VYDEVTHMNATQKTRKNGGRPRLKSDEDREKIRKLYFDEKWTAKRIKELLFPELLIDTIRQIARCEAVKKENAPEAATCEGVTTDSERPEPTTIPNDSTDGSSAQAGAQPETKEV
jgi:hypothetical protein